MPILKAFNEYQLGIYEQALFSYYKPELNTQLQCKFLFLNWFKGQSTEMSQYLGSVESIMKINSVNQNKFDFSLYYELCKTRNILPKVNDRWLEWFVGYSEQRGYFNTYYKRQSYTFFNNSFEFLNYIKENLILESTIISRSNNKKMFYISNSYD